MRRDDLVASLDEYFRVPSVIDDDWSEIFAVVYETPYWQSFVESSWVERWNGLMLRGSDEVTRVATCVFPSDEIFARLQPGTFLFTEHPIDDAQGDVFAPWSKGTFERAKDLGISVYTAHAPLDHHPEMSASRLIATRLGLSDLEEYLPAARGIPGGSAIIGNSTLTVAALHASLQHILGDDIPVLTVNAPRENAGRVSVVAGGGADLKSLEASMAKGCNTYVTGNAASPCWIPFVKEIHAAFRDRAKAEGIAVIDGTHYGTEKLPQLEMIAWFRRLGLEATFEAGRPERT